MSSQNPNLNPEDWERGHIPILHGPMTPAEQKQEEDRQRGIAKENADRDFQERQVKAVESANKLARRNLYLTGLVALISVIACVGTWYQGRMNKHSWDVAQATLDQMRSDSQESSNQFQAQLHHFDDGLGRTGLLAIHAGEQAGSANDSLHAFRENSRQELRSWVGIESVAPKNFWRPLGNIQMEVELKLRNYGKSIANRVGVTMQIQLMTPENRHYKPCDRYVQTNDLGYNLIPNETLIETVSNNIQANEIEEYIRKLPHGDRSVFLKVVGCVVYADGAKQTATHHPPFSYGLQIKNNASYITAETPALSGDMLELRQLSIYLGSAD